MRDRLCEYFDRYALTGHLVATMRTAFALLALAVVLGALSFCAGCGASPREQHTALNRITAVADPTYALAVDTCGEAYDFIADRTATTHEEDVKAFGDVAEVCDPMIEGFEGLRGSQLTARAYIDGGASGAVATAIMEALALWARLQALVPQLDTLGRSEVD